jgi:hypothetical protein
MGAYGNTEQASLSPLPGGTYEEESEDLLAPGLAPERVVEQF